MRVAAVIGWVLIASIAVAGEASPNPAPTEGLSAGEAEIRYLGHAGWLVRTSEHLLVFDYTGPTGGGIE